MMRHKNKKYDVYETENIPVTEMILPVAAGAVVLTAPGAVSNICRSVDTD